MRELSWEEWFKSDYGQRSILVAVISWLIFSSIFFFFIAPQGWFLIIFGLIEIVSLESSKRNARQCDHCGEIIHRMAIVQCRHCGPNCPKCGTRVII